jgi:hypothetical protein
VRARERGTKNERKSESKREGDEEREKEWDRESERERARIKKYNDLSLVLKKKIIGLKDIQIFKVTDVKKKIYGREMLIILVYTLQDDKKMIGRNCLSKNVKTRRKD